ncbi:LppX_LprAFG lipoprotein [Pedococcus sp. NPDC057267]|uniref:LppX_LprAFG lipoprotein n=1 Tax=Pedococcus sp. NPDC057267 TaxID=3346077 RepID=UPI0036257F3B
MRPPGRYAVVTALAVGLASGLLTACSGGGKASAKAELPPAQRLAAARDALEKSPAVSFTLTSEGLPGKAVGVSAAQGTGLFRPPSFKGTLNASIGGVTGTVEVVAVEQDVYLKFFTPGFTKIDPKTYGAPNPAQLFNTQTGVTSLVSRTTGLAAGPRTRDGATIVDTYTGKVPGTAVADLFVIGDRSGTFDVTYGVAEDGDELRSVVLKGPFYAGSTSTYTARLTKLPQAVAIPRP